MEEEERLLACSEPNLKPILVSALNTGMRRGEILSLKWSNIDLDHDIITLFEIIHALPSEQVFASTEELDLYLDRMQKKILEE